MLRALSVVDDDGALAEVYVFDAQAEGFHEAEAGAIHELGGEFPGIFEMREDGLDFLAGQHDGRSALGVAGSRFFESKIRLAKDLASEEDHRVERLFLGGGGDVAFEREVAEVIGDPLRSGILRGLFEADQAEAGEAGVPMDVGLMAAAAATLRAVAIAPVYLAPLGCSVAKLRPPRRTARRTSSQMRATSTAVSGRGPAGTGADFAGGTRMVSRPRVR